MREAELIEIAQRFRKLEDHIEAADLFLASFVEVAERRISKAEAAHAANEISYAEYCRRVNEPEADLMKLGEVRSDIERATEACRQDMVRLSEEARKARR